MSKAELITDPEEVQNILNLLTRGNKRGNRSKVINMLEVFDKSDSYVMKYTPSPGEYSNMNSGQTTWAMAVKRLHYPMKVVTYCDSIYILKLIQPEVIPARPAPRVIQSCDTCRRRSDCLVYVPEGSPCGDYFSWGGEGNA